MINSKGSYVKNDTFIENFKRIQWDKFPKVLSLFGKVLSIAAVLTGILYLFERLVSLVLGVVA